MTSNFFSTTKKRIKKKVVRHTHLVGHLNDTYIVYHEVALVTLLSNKTNPREAIYHALGSPPAANNAHKQQSTTAWSSSAWFWWWWLVATGSDSGNLVFNDLLGLSSLAHPSCLETSSSRYDDDSMAASSTCNPKGHANNKYRDSFSS